MFEGKPLFWGKGRDMMICGQSQSGAHGDSYQSNSSSSSTSGYDTLENFIKEHKDRLCDGAYVIDSRGLTWDQACNCISGPMEKCQLDPLTIDSWGKISKLEPKDLLNLPEIKGFNYVSLDIYAAFWRKIGSRIGRYCRSIDENGKDNSEVIWEK